MKLRFVSYREQKTPIKILIVRERGGCKLDVREEDHPVCKQKVLHFDGAIPIESDDSKKFEVIKDGDTVMDYRNVRIKGYLSTFQGTTPSDRDGEYVVPGAFKESIPMFMAKNPVMLKDHRAQTESIAGKFTAMKEDRKGLYVEAELSNGPSNLNTRFLVAEGTLKTMSIGGLFHYSDDGRGIFKVSLWEGSLVALPANPDAIIQVRALTTDEMKKYAKQFEAALV